MSIPVLECPGEWSNDCGCPGSHNSCWPRPDTACCEALQITPEMPPERVLLIERMLRMSVSVMNAFSGRQFGLCPRTVRPCRDRCRDSGGILLEPYILDGEWFNNSCQRCVTDCSCTEVCEVTLPGPVHRILQVRLDGAVLDPETYRVDNHRKLVRTGVTLGTAARSSLVVFNFADPATTLCFPNEPIGVIGDLTPTPDPTPPFCYAVTGGTGQRVVMQPGCQLFTANVSAFDSGSPLAFLESGEIAYPFTAGTVLTAGGAAAVSGWLDNVRMRIRLVSGPAATLTADGVITNLAAGVSTFEVCFEQRTYSSGSVGCWPTCQDMTLPATQPGTWDVQYLRGKPVPEFGLYAAGMFACELVKACLPDAGDCCRLPANVQSIVREGVSMELEAFTLGGVDGKAEFGRTGIPEVDMWLTMVNPHRSTGPSRAYSPDRPRPRRTTWPCDE